MNSSAWPCPLDYCRSIGIPTQYSMVSDSCDSGSHQDAPGDNFNSLPRSNTSLAKSFMLPLAQACLSHAVDFRYALSVVGPRRSAGGLEAKIAIVSLDKHHDHLKQKSGLTFPCSSLHTLGNRLNNSLLLRQWTTGRIYRCLLSATIDCGTSLLISIAGDIWN